MEIEISGLFLRVAVQFCLAGAGLLMALCALGEWASDRASAPKPNP